MSIEYSHQGPYKGSQNENFEIRVVDGVPCDCLNLDQISYVTPNTNEIWNNNSCFQTSWEDTFLSKPYHFPIQNWKGPGKYKFGVLFVTKKRFAESNLHNVFNFRSVTENPYLHVVCVFDVLVDTQGFQNDIYQSPTKLSGIDYILTTSPEPADLLFDWDSSDLSGQSSKVNSWDGNIQGRSARFTQSTSSYQPENLQEFIRYDQGQSIESAVRFDSNDHLNSLSTYNALTSSDDFILNGNLHLFIVAEPTSGNADDNNLISFFTDSYTSGSGFSLQAISGVSHSGRINFSGANNQSYDFSYDNIEPGPSIYHLSFNNSANSFGLSINGYPKTGVSFTLPYEGYYRLGSGFEGNIYQVLGVSDFKDSSAQEFVGSLSQRWGISNKIPTDNPFYQPSNFALAVENPENFQIEGLGSYQSGELAVIELTPNRGISFSGWSGAEILNKSTILNTKTLDNVVYQSNTYASNVLITGDIILSGVYNDLPEYDLNISGSGTHEGTGSYFSGETISISTSTSHLQKFVEWESGTVDDAYNVNTNITLTGDTTLFAKYRDKNLYNVILQGEGALSGSGSFYEDSLVSITGSEPPTYKYFSNWEVTSGSSLATIEQDFHYIENASERYNLNSNPTKFIITGDIELTARHELIQYNINAIAAYDNGIISGVQGNNYFNVSDQTYTGTQQVQLTGVPDSGYAFIHWDTGDENYYSGEILNSTVTGDMNVSAVFVPAYEFKYQNYTGCFSGGYISGTETGVYTSDSGITFSVISESGFEFDQWIFDEPINPINDANNELNYTGSGYSGVINFLQTSLGFNAKGQPTSENIDGFNGGNSVLGSAENYPWTVEYSDYIFQTIQNYNSTTYNLRILDRQNRSRILNTTNSKFSMNGSYDGQEKIINYSISNPLWLSINGGDLDTDPVNTVYSSTQIQQQGALHNNSRGEQISTNSFSISGAQLNPDNKILTFKASLVYYKESDITTPNIRLELFPSEENNDRPEEEAFSILDDSYYKASLQNRSFRGAYFDIKNNKLYKGRAAPNGFEYKYEMILAFENSEYAEYDIYVSVLAENNHSTQYTLFFQPFAVNDFNKIDDYNFKFGVKNLFFGQLSQRKVYNFDQVVQPGFVNRNLSYDFCATVLFRKINNERFESLSHSLPYTPELLRNDFEHQGSRLFVFGKYQTEVPLPNSFDKDDQYKLGLNAPNGHRFSRYRAVGKGIRSDVGFFELNDQSVSLDSLFERRYVKISSKIQEKKYDLGSDEFYDFFGFEWSNFIEKVPSSLYTPVTFLTSYEIKLLNRWGTNQVIAKDPGSYKYMQSDSLMANRHYYGINSFYSLEAAAAREQGRDLREEVYQALREIYDNDPLITSYQIDPWHVSAGYLGFTAFNIMFSVSFTQAPLYRFKTGASNSFLNSYSDFYDIKLSSRPFYGSTEYYNQPEINPSFRFSSIDPVFLYSSRNNYNSYYCKGYLIKPQSVKNFADTSVVITANKVASNINHFRPKASVPYFDCKLIQSNIAENSLRYIAQCKKTQSKLPSNIEWTSTDGENISDATFRFRGTTSGGKDIFKIYRVLNTTAEKYVGQMTCLDAKEGEFFINWDGDLSDANISTSNFNRPSNKLSISHGFSLTKKLFNSEYANSFYNPVFNNGNIKSISSVGKYVKNNLGFMKGYNVNSKNINNFPFSRPSTHPLLGRGFFYETGDFLLSDWVYFLSLLLSVQEYMQDYFALLFPQGNAMRSYLKTVRTKKTPVWWTVTTVYGGTSSESVRRGTYTESFLKIINGSETYPGIEVDYHNSENIFTFSNNDIIIPTLNSPSIISSAVSTISDNVDDDVNQLKFVGYENLNLADMTRTSRISKSIGSVVQTYFIDNLYLKNNFLLTNPDIAFEEEHYNLLDNIITMCDMFDISSEYNRFARAHWSEATPSSVLEDANSNFTNLTFGDDDIHLEIIYDE